MSIRRAGPDDAATLLPLVERYWAFEGLEGFRPDSLRSALQRLLASPELGAAWIATEDGQAVGYLIVVLVFSLEHHGLTAEIDEAFVMEEHRAAGIGSALLAQAEVESRRRGCGNISLQIGTGNRRAMAFYRRHGYAPRGGFRLLEKDLSGR